MDKVEVVYVPHGLPPIHEHVAFEVGTTVAEVIMRTSLWKTHPEIEGMAVGIFARIVSPDTVVKAGDRIEIYRPLLIDPKEKRRQRARQKN